MRLRRRAAGTLALALLAGTCAAAPASAAPVPDPVLSGVDLQQATIPELERAMAAHRFGSTELTAFYLRRVHLLNSRLHAVVSTNPAPRFLPTLG